MLQGFEWNCSGDGKHYDRLCKTIPAFQQCGISNIWLPPGCKAGLTGVNDISIQITYHLTDIMTG